MMRHLGTRPLETSRLLLRPYRVEDAKAMFSNWATDLEVTRFLRWEPHKNPQETKDVLASWVASYQNAEFYLWAMERKEDGQLLGGIGIFDSSEADEPGGWEPAYCLGRAFWNQGYTTEALRAVMDYFTESTGITTLYCCHAAENPASGRVMEHCGFVRTGNCVYHRFDGSEVAAFRYIYKKDNI